MKEYKAKEDFHIGYRCNNIILTNEQIRILKENNILFNKVKYINELMYLIDKNLDNNHNDELERIYEEISEFNYYHNINK